MEALNNSTISRLNLSSKSFLNVYDIKIPNSINSFLSAQSIFKVDSRYWKWDESSRDENFGFFDFHMLRSGARHASWKLLDE